MAQQQEPAEHECPKCKDDLKRSFYYDEKGHKLPCFKWRASKFKMMYGGFKDKDIVYKEIEFGNFFIWDSRYKRMRPWSGGPSTPSTEEDN